MLLSKVEMQPEKNKYFDEDLQINKNPFYLQRFLLLKNKLNLIALKKNLEFHLLIENHTFHLLNE